MGKLRDAVSDWEASPYYLPEEELFDLERFFRDHGADEIKEKNSWKPSKGAIRAWREWLEEWVDKEKRPRLRLVRPPEKEAE